MWVPLARVLWGGSSKRRLELRPKDEESLEGLSSRSGGRDGKEGGGSGAGAGRACMVWGGGRGGRTGPRFLAEHLGE